MQGVPAGTRTEALSARSGGAIELLTKRDIPREGAELMFINRPAASDQAVEGLHVDQITLGNVTARFRQDDEAIGAGHRTEDA